jgi:transcriptional regulator with XRE-family HTH domain
MTQDGAGGSYVRRWQLAASLKAAREAAQLTQDEAIAKLGKGAGRWSRSKLSRIENREHTLKPREVMQLLDAYGVVEAKLRKDLTQLATDSRERGWWVRFGAELPEALKPLLSIEAGMVGLRDFQSQLVHGLLQTADYARAVMDSVNPGVCSPEELERRVAARMIRQHVLRRPNPPQLHFVMDQVILQRVIGTRTIMRDQLRKLLDLTENPAITIQILPLKAGGGPGLVGPFAVLTLPEPIPDIVFAEGPAGMVYIEDREHVRMCTLRFGILTELALSQADSADLIAETLQTYE